jgi:hypothetical protein
LGSSRFCDETFAGYRCWAAIDKLTLTVDTKDLLLFLVVVVLMTIMGIHFAQQYLH